MISEELDRTDIALFGVEYATNQLGIPMVDVKFETKSSFKTMNDSAIYTMTNNSITFNSDWVDNADIMDILKCSFFNTHLAYQYSYISNMSQLKQEPEVLRLWAYEVHMYNNHKHKSISDSVVMNEALKFAQNLLYKVLIELEDERFDPENAEHLFD